MLNYRNSHPPLNGGITAISSVERSEMTALSDRSMYSQFNANNILFCIGCNLNKQTVNTSSSSSSSAAAAAAAAAVMEKEIICV